MQKLCATLAILFLFISTVNAQFDPSKVNKKAAQLYSKALETAEGGNFPESIKILKARLPIPNRWQGLQQRGL